MQVGKLAVMVTRFDAEVCKSFLRWSDTSNNQMQKAVAIVSFYAEISARF
jgi:hypothetical protein